jgi:hypothetical protein
MILKSFLSSNKNRDTRGGSPREVAVEISEEGLSENRKPVRSLPRRTGEIVGQAKISIWRRGAHHPC